MLSNSETLRLTNRGIPLDEVEDTLKYPFLEDAL